MADNVTLNAGSGGAVLATDDVSSVHYPINKLAHGALESVTLVSLTSGLPVQNDDTDLKVTMDGEAVVLGAGTAEIGKLAAGVAEIGNVANSGTFAVQIADTSFAVADGNALGEGVLIQGDDGTDRKNINVDATTGDVQVDVTNTVSVDGSGVTQPVSAASLPLPSGASTSALQTSSEAILTTIDADTGGILTAVQLIDNAVSGSGFNITQLNGVNVSMGNGVSGTGVQRVTLASDGTGAVIANGGVAHDGVDSGNPLKIGGKAYSFDGTPPQTAVAEADRVNAIFTPQGRQYVETTHPNYFRSHVDYASAQTNATIKTAPGAGLKLYITDVLVSNGATAGNITLLDGSGGTVLLELYPAINGGLTHSFRTPLALTANTLLAITSTTVTTHSVTITGFVAA